MWRSSLLGVFAVAFGALAADRAFVSYAEVKPILEAQKGQFPAGLNNASQDEWNDWSRDQDKAIRARLEQGDLDTMVNLLLLGTSFTSQPRIGMENLSEASRAGVLKARVDDLVAGLRSPGDNERLVFLNGLLRNRGMDPSTEAGAQATGVFLLTNLERVVEEARAIGERAAAAKAKAGPARDPASLLDRYSVFSERGVSLDTSILPDFSIEQTLRDLKQRGMLREGQMERVAVIGPGLDFIDKNEQAGYDYYPQQTLQPFALYDSLLRLGLAKDNRVSVSILDISSRVIDHVQRARERAANNVPYVIQLPRDISRPWPKDVIEYWRTFGDRVGKSVTPIRPPEVFKGLETRAVEVRPEVVLACQPTDLNIVLERLNLDPADRFDLVIGTNIFVYYDAFQQTLALENAGAMLKPGGVLLTNDRLPEFPGGSMRLAGLTDVQLDNDGSISHLPIGWYQKRP